MHSYDGVMQIVDLKYGVLILVLMEDALVHEAETFFLTFFGKS